MMKFKVAGLVADLMPNIRLIQASGHFMLNYHADNSGAVHTLRLGYCCAHLVFMFLQYWYKVKNIYFSFFLTIYCYYFTYLFVGIGYIVHIVK